MEGERLYTLAEAHGDEMQRTWREYPSASLLWKNVSNSGAEHDWHSSCRRRTRMFLCGWREYLTGIARVRSYRAHHRLLHDKGDDPHASSLW